MISRWLFRAAGIGGAAVLVVGLGGSAQAQRSDQNSNITRQMQGQALVPLPSLSPIVERVSPAVVNISVVMGDQAIAQGDQDGGETPNFPPSPFDDFLRRFFEQQGMPSGEGPRPQPRSGRAMALGSGFIISADGYVVTNNHVVGNAEKVTVVLSDNTKHPAHIVGRDEQTDVALLKIDAGRPLAFVSWGDSDAAKVGDWVVAVGNPFGLGGTVTSGIISALGRNIEAGPYDDFLQIDASINRGNSGGPTFDLSGQVIGINTAIYSPSGGSVGIGFAVPSSLAHTVVDQLKQHGYVTRGWLGVQVQKITPALAKTFGLNPDDPKGALVANVTDNSPAAKASLKQGDVITRFNGKEVKDVHDLPRLVAETPPGQKVDITVLRQGREQTVQATIEQMKGQPKVAASDSGRGPRPRPRHSGALGLQLAPLDDQGRDQTAGQSGDKSGRTSGQGVVVRAVAPDSVAAGLVQPGDVILSVNLQPVDNPAEAAQLLREGAAKRQVVLLVEHDGGTRFVGLPVEETRGGYGGPG